MPFSKWWVPPSDGTPPPCGLAVFWPIHVSFFLFLCFSVSFCNFYIFIKLGSSPVSDMGRELNVEG